MRLNKKKLDNFNGYLEGFGDVLDALPETIINAKLDTFDKVNQMLRQWNCHNDPTIEKTINTVILRIEQLKQEAQQ